ncbi:MAG: PKD domain-containing protein [Bacteroidetes bacterium]|nr:PKD domain-containing protein [Bacteroidota bacterium]
MKKLILHFILLLIVFSAVSQTPVYISGMITDAANGNPVANHAVTIWCDSINPPYYQHTVYTNQTGEYADTIPSAYFYAFTFGCTVGTYDCNNVFRHQGVTYVPGVYSYAADLQICTTSPCTASFTYTPDWGNKLFITFTNQSTGTYTSCHWNFGDGHESWMLNPVNIYSHPGTYLVTLAIFAWDSLGYNSCNDTTFQTISVGSFGECHAAFSHAPEQNDPGTINFTNESTGGFTASIWKFGDGTSIWEQNPTHRYQIVGTYDVTLSIFDWDSLGNVTCHDSITQSVFVDNVGCKSYFFYYAVNLDVNFSGYMDSWVWATYSWDFGDGSTGQGQMVTHAYAQPGIYPVQLTTRDSSQCQFITMQYLEVGDTAVVKQVYGQVFAGNFPLDTGEVMIFSVDSTGVYFPYSHVSPIDSAGVYEFLYVPVGSYYIWAIPNSNDYLPTYFGDVVYWEQATPFTLGNPDNPYNIHLIPAPGYTSGPGNINGHINSGKSIEAYIDKISMLIRSEQGVVLSSVQVNTGGNFNFTGLAYGTYYLVPELPGCPGDVIKVVLAQSNPNADVTLTFTGGHILGTSDLKRGEESVIVYPNPVTDQLTLSVNLQKSCVIRVEISTLTGQVVYSDFKPVREGQTKITLPFGGLNEGIYFVKIQSEEGINMVKKVIKSR